MLDDDPTLAEMDALGTSYWPGDVHRSHTMRKFCAFWGPHRRFVFLDADIVVLKPLEAYLDALGDHDLMYFATDVSTVYRPGPVRDEMTRRFQTAGFITGTFVARAGLLAPSDLEEIRVRAESHRHGFVDILEQTFVNYVADTNGWSKVSARDAVPTMVDAGALMRLRPSGCGLVLDDVRVRETGREVSLIHWAGYSLGPLMPYRRTFLAYRLPDHSLSERLAYEARDVRRALRHARPGSALRLLHRARSELRNRLAARGWAAWSEM